MKRKTLVYVFPYPSCSLIDTPTHRRAHWNTGLQTSWIRWKMSDHFGNELATCCVRVRVLSHLQAANRVATARWAGRAVRARRQGERVRERA